ncbi:Uma2 family endonuclease [Streptomyces sp. GC420]|nr:Uma2 family endonuclease [Streptomyces sp. GC420]
MVAEAQEHLTESTGPATPDNWMYPPEDGWTYDQVRELVLPYAWELLGGKIVVRGATKWWHDLVRDELYYRLRSARREPFAVNTERWIKLDERNAPRPDVVVFDKRGLDVQTLDCIPAEKVALAIEVVSPGSRSEDRILKPGLYAAAGIENFWRVERSEEGLPEVHEFWLDEEAAVYVPATARKVHTAKLAVDEPFPVEIDLRGLVEA